MNCEWCHILGFKKNPKNMTPFTVSCLATSYLLLKVTQ